MRFFSVGLPQPSQQCGAVIHNLEGEAVRWLRPTRTTGQQEKHITTFCFFMFWTGNNVLLLDTSLKFMSCKKKAKNPKWFEKLMKCLLSLQIFQLHFQEALAKAGGAGCVMEWFPLHLSNASARVYGSSQTSLCFLESMVATTGKGRH